MKDIFSCMSPLEIGLLIFVTFVAFPGALILMVDGPHLSVISVFIFLYLRGGREEWRGGGILSINILLILSY